MVDLTVVKQFWFAAVIGIMGIGLIGFGAYDLTRSKLSPTQVAPEVTPNISATPVPTAVRMIEVDVSGAVTNPGVYALPQGSRVRDALKLAGDFSIDADKKWISRNINLAAVLVDGGKLYIPKVGEDEASAPPVLGASQTSPTTTEKINVNAATVSQLDALPGVGPATAQKIVNGRPYSSIEDLTAKKSVSANVFDKIKDLVSVY